jgi:glycosyltransferase involved in cell wall biosynthesis
LPTDCIGNPVAHGMTRPEATMETQRQTVMLAHPTGGNHARLMARALSRAGRLRHFYVGLNLNFLRPILPYLPQKLAKSLKRRAFDIPDQEMRQVPIFELPMVFMENVPVLKNSGFCKKYRFVVMNKFFDGQIAKRVYKADASAFYCYIESGLQSMRAAKAHGMFGVVEVTSAVHAFNQQLMAQEARLMPDWASTLAAKERDHAAIIAEQAELLELADMICVPSTFILNSLPEQVKGKAHVFSYGHPAASPTEKAIPGAAPLKILFVGNLTQIKGIGYVAACLDRILSFGSMTVVGRSAVHDNHALESFKKRVTWIPSLPNTELLALMHRSDVLVLPSISESFGMVVSEALAQGTPVIVSENVGAKDLVVEGVNGFVVPIRDPQAIADRLALLHSDRQLLHRMSRAAREIARQGAGADNADAIVQLIAARMDQARTEPGIAPCR